MRVRSSSLIVFACHAKACAPPPAGTGGSNPGGHGEALGRLQGLVDSMDEHVYSQNAVDRFSGLLQNVHDTLAPVAPHHEDALGGLQETIDGIGSVASVQRNFQGIRRSLQETHDRLSAPAPRQSGAALGKNHSIVVKAGPRSTIRRQIKVTHIHEDGSLSGVGKIHGVPYPLHGWSVHTHRGDGPNVVPINPTQ